MVSVSTVGEEKMNSHTLIEFQTDDTGRRVVRKTARSEEKKAQLAREAATLRLVSHDNVVTYIDFDSRGLWLESIDGVELGKLQRERPLPFGAVSYIAWEILTALDAVHEAGYIHGDLSPHNIMITRKGSVKILDFGLSCKIGSAVQGRHVYGTMGYISPEKARRRSLDARTDLFSVGVLLSELLSGARYRPKNRRDAFDRALNGETVPTIRNLRAGIPDSLDALVSALLLTDRDERPASAVEARAYLLAPRIEDKSEIVYEVAQIMRPTTRGRWSTVRWLGFTLAALAVGSAGYTVGNKQPRQSMWELPLGNLMPHAEVHKRRPIRYQHAPRFSISALPTLSTEKRRKKRRSPEVGRVAATETRTEMEQVVTSPEPATTIPIEAASPSNIIDVRPAPGDYAVSSATQHCYGQTSIVISNPHLEKAKCPRGTPGYVEEVQE